MTSNCDIRILIAKPGLDGHDVGAKVIVRALKEAGFQVSYTGLRKTPQEIVAAACQQEVHVLGLSILSGSHLPICRQIAELLQGSKLLESSGRAKLLWIAGGNIPAEDCDALLNLGVDAVFPVGTPLESVVDYIREKVS